MSLKLRKPLRKFADFMELKLRRNNHKKGWKNCDDVDLFDCLRGEVEELRLSLKISANPMTIAQEAADVANFAMMIADNAGALKPSYPLTLSDVPKPPKEK